MNLPQLISALQQIQADCEGSPHSMEGGPSVRVHLDYEGYDLMLEPSLIEVRPEMRIGCGCWEGAVLVVKLTPET